MACALTTGFTIDCKNANGGIEAVYFTELANKATLTAASGVITAFTLTGGKVFFKYELRKKVGLFEQNFQLNQENGTTFYEQTLSIKLDALTAVKRNEIMLLAQNRLMIIIKDNNGVFWLMGETRGADMNGGKAGTGTAFGDLSGFEPTFMAEEPALAQQVTASLMDTLSP